VESEELNFQIWYLKTMATIADTPVWLPLRPWLWNPGWLTQAELEVVRVAGLVVLQVQVFDQHHDRRVDVLRVLDEPLTVQVVAVVGQQVPGRSEVPPRRVVQDSTTL